jgi:hypothetical protein
MADTLSTLQPRKLLVNGRNPFADEIVTVSDPTILSVAAPDSNSETWVTGLADGLATITVQPGSEDPDSVAGSDDVTVFTPSALVVSLA